MSKSASEGHDVVESVLRGFMMSFITSAATSSDVLRTVIRHNYRKTFSLQPPSLAGETYLGFSVGLQSHQAADLAIGRHM